MLEIFAQGRGGKWTGKQASLNGLANCVAGGVFRCCQLSCDSQQPFPSNHACGVPSSTGMGGWDRGSEAAWREQGSGSGGDGPKRPAAPSFPKWKGSTKDPGSPLTLSQRSPHPP